MRFCLCVRFSFLFCCFVRAGFALFGLCVGVCLSRVRACARVLVCCLGLCAWRACLGTSDLRFKCLNISSPHAAHMQNRACHIICVCMLAPPWHGPSFMLVCMNYVCEFMLLHTYVCCFLHHQGMDSQHWVCFMYRAYSSDHLEVRQSCLSIRLDGSTRLCSIVQSRQ